MDIVLTETNANLLTGVTNSARTTKKTVSIKLNNVSFSLRKGAAPMVIAAISYTEKRMTFAHRN